MFPGVTEYADRYELAPTVPVEQRVALLDRIARDGASNNQVLATAREHVAAYGRTPKTLQRLAFWVRVTLTYKLESGEVYAKVPTILARKVDDCDGYTTLWNALAIAAGFDAGAEYVVTGLTAHVLSRVAVVPGLPRVPIDVTIGGELGETTRAAQLRLFGL